MKKKDFNNIFKNGKTKVGKLVFLKILKNNSKINKLGVVVSAKISKKAVIRNKIKRRIREIIRQANLKNGFNIIAVAKPEIIDKNYQEIKIDVENLLKNI